MKNSRFKQLVNNRLLVCRQTLESKGADYSGSKDRLKAFRVAARARGVSMAEALEGMRLKHEVSVWQCIGDMQEHPSYVPGEDWVDEKIGDSINYLLLLEAVIEDRRARHETPDV